MAEGKGVSPWTVLNWEQGSVIRAPKHHAAVIQFLGYNPESAPQSFGEKMRVKRRELGWSAKDTAKYLEVDESTIHAWEARGEVPRWPRLRSLTEAFLETPLASLLEQTQNSPE